MRRTITGTWQVDAEMAATILADAPEEVAELGRREALVVIQRSLVQLGRVCFDYASERWGDEWETRYREAREFVTANWPEWTFPGEAQAD